MASRSIIWPRRGLALLMWGLAASAYSAETNTAATEAKGAATPSSKTNASAAVTTVSRGSFRSVLRPQIDLPLTSRAAGIVEAIRVPEGTAVKAGQPIISLDSEQEKADVAQAEAALRGAKAEQERATAEFDRIKQLYTENISSEKIYVDAKAGAALAASRTDQAAAALQLAKARLANRTITSTIDGLFLKTNKVVGDPVDRYETVGHVFDVTSLEMMVFCDARYISLFRAGQRIEIRVFKSAEEQPIVSGVIFHVDPIIDPSSGTFRIKIKVEPSATAVAGLTAFVVAPP